MDEITAGAPQRIALLLTSAYLWLSGFVVPIEYRAMATLAYAYCMAVLLAVSVGDLLRRRYATSHVVVTLLLFASFAAVVLLSPYATSGIAQTLAFLVIALFVFGPGRQGEQALLGRFDVFYAGALLALGAALARALATGEFLVLNGLTDKNYSAILIFLFFCYCMKRRYRLGIVLSVLYLAAQPSRVYVLMLVAFWVIRIAKHRFPPIARAWRPSFGSPGAVRVMFALMLAGVLVFSPLWVAVFVSDFTTTYRQSLNDDSNAMRAYGNVYAAQLIASDAAFALYGYDDDTLSMLGVTAYDVREHARVGGYRLVQTHHSVLNLVLKFGVLFTALYLVQLSYLLNRYFDYNNLEYWLSYLLAGMVMHSLLNGFFLLFWLFVLSLPAAGQAPGDVTDRVKLPTRGFNLGQVG